MDKILKLDFLSGKKTYIAMAVVILQGWVSFLLGGDVTCLATGGTEAACGADAPTLGAALNQTWLAVSGMFFRKGLS